MNYSSGTVAEPSLVAAAWLQIEVRQGRPLVQKAPGMCCRVKGMKPCCFACREQL